MTRRACSGGGRTEREDACVRPVDAGGLPSRVVAGWGGERGGDVREMRWHRPGGCRKGTENGLQYACVLYLLTNIQHVSVISDFFIIERYKRRGYKRRDNDIHCRYSEKIAHGTRAGHKDKSIHSICGRHAERALNVLVYPGRAPRLIGGRPHPFQDLHKLIGGN